MRTWISWSLVYCLDRYTSKPFSAINLAFLRTYVLFITCSSFSPMERKDKGPVLSLEDLWHLKSGWRNNLKSREVIRTQSGMRKTWRPMDREKKWVSNPARRSYKIWTECVCLNLNMEWWGTRKQNAEGDDAQVPSEKVDRPEGGNTFVFGGCEEDRRWWW